MSKLIDETPIANTFISHDVPCHRCAYNLRGLTREGRCPECGAPVRVSLQGDLLRFADPAWLKRLLRGTRMGAYALMGMGVTSVGASLIRLLFGDFMGWSQWEHVTIAGDLIMFVLGYGFLLFGLWLIATPNPVTVAEEGSLSARRILRLTVLLSIATFGVSAWLYVCSPRNLFWYTVAFLTISPFGVLTLPGSWAISRYAMQLSRRLPCGFGWHFAASSFEGYVISWAFFAVGALSSGMGFLPSGYSLFLLAILGVLFFGFLCLFMPQHFARVIEKEIEEARRLWEQVGEAADDDHVSGVQSPPANIQRAQRDSEVMP